MKPYRHILFHILNTTILINCNVVKKKKKEQKKYLSYLFKKKKKIWKMNHNIKI